MNTRSHTKVDKTKI